MSAVDMKTALRVRFVEHPCRIRISKSAAIIWNSHITEVHGERLRQGTRGLVAMTSAQHAEGRQFDPGRVYAQQQCLGDSQGAFGTASIHVE